MHRESDKFVIANEEPYTKNLTKENIFASVEDGEPVIIQKSFEMVKGLVDSWKKVFPRKEEVRDMLIFLQDQNRILIVVGQPDIGRSQTVARAIHYAVEHDYDSVADGAFYIDMMEVQSIEDVCHLLVQKIGLSTKPDENQIVYDTYLKYKRSALIFANMPSHNEVFVKNFMRFVKRLKYETRLH